MDLKTEVLELERRVLAAKDAPLLQKAAAAESLVGDAVRILGESCARVERLELIVGQLSLQVRAERERAAQVVEDRGREIGGAVDPKRTAKAIREGGKNGG